MHQAKDPKTGDIVRASEASRYGYYTCPVCKAAVSLRHGDFRAAYFAHRSGLASPDCELYVHADDIGQPWPSLPTLPHGGEAREGSRIAPFALSIALEPEAQGRASRLRKWNLALTVPKSVDDHGQVSINCGGGFVPKISLTKLVVAPQTYRAHPESPDYGAVWISPEVRPEYRLAVTRRIPGLRIGQATVFATSPQKYKPRVESLSWATSYYFVWRQDSRCAVPEELPSHQLADNGAWRCALVSLPDEGTAELLAWLQDACGLNVAHEKRKWSIVYPVAYDVDVSGRIQVSPSHTLFLGTYAGSDSTDQDSSLDCAAGDVRAYIGMRPGGWHFIEVTANEAVGESVLSLNWDHRLLPELARVPFADAAQPPAVVLGFHSKKTGSWSQARMHQASCVDALRRVRAAVSDISQIHLPCGIGGQLKWRSTSDSQWQSLTLIDTAPRDTRGQGILLSPHQLAAINRALQDPKLEAWLDFGAFGQFHAPAEQPTQLIAPMRRLQPALRAKIVWFCKTSKTYETPAGEPIDELDDEQLVAHFESVRAASRLVAHRRSIEYALDGAHKPPVRNG